MNGVRRFDDLVTRLAVSRATLADRLRRLVTAGILVPAPYQTDGGRTREEYRLTEKGWDLRNVLIALREWGDRYVLGDGRHPVAPRRSGDGSRRAAAPRRRRDWQGGRGTPAGARHRPRRAPGAPAMTLRIGLSVDPSMPRFLDVARQAERIGVDSVWVAEYWAFDAFTPLAAVAAVTERLRLATGIAQLGARTPAMLAMTAQGVQPVSDGRLILGIGTSGPQVMEGWHGVPFDRPVQRTRETIEIVRMITAGERLVLRRYRVPTAAARQRRAGDPFAGARWRRSRSTSRRSARRTWRSPASWPTGGSATRSSPTAQAAFFDPIAAGAAGAGRSLDDIDRVVAVSLELTADDPAAIEAAGRRHADGYAFTFGAMGTASKNFYNDAFARQGYGDDVEAVRQLWAAGDRDCRRGTGADRDRRSAPTSSDRRR